MRKISKVGKIGIATLGMAALMAPVADLTGVESASAACAMNWEKVGDSSGWSVNTCQGSSSDKTFASEISADQIITVTLNNYKGGAFELNGYGTGVPVKKVIFKLTGQNEIKAEDGIGLALDVPVEFTGEGSLTLKAMIPLIAHDAYVTDAYQSVEVTSLLEDYAKYWSQNGGYVQELTISPAKAGISTEKPEEKPSDEEEKPEEEPSEKPEETEKPADEPSGETTEKTVRTPEMIAIHAAAGTYILLSVVIFILLGIRKIKSKHAPKETKKIVIEETEVDMTDGAEKTEKKVSEKKTEEKK